MLEREGFRVVPNVGGMATAFVAEWGSGGPWSASSASSTPCPIWRRSPASPNTGRPSAERRATAAATTCWEPARLAAVALKDALEREGIAGTVRYYGCPAEESGSGKTFMARAGLFHDLDAAFCWHPSVVNEVQTSSSLACIQAYFRFKGRAAHAAAAPHVGRSALDAVELMNVGVNYMREHMPSDARVHYATTNTGGSAPNVVQALPNRSISCARRICPMRSACSSA